MENKIILKTEKELDLLCSSVRKLVEHKKYQDCELIIRDAIGKHPHAPHPQNLMGILLEMEGDHLTAMKHFRAAWALDPTYIPVRFNLEHFGTFFSRGKCAFDESDCPQENKDRLYIIEHDLHGIRHVVRRE